MRKPYVSSTFHKQTHEIINVKAKGFLVVVIASLFGERDVLCSKQTKWNKKRMKNWTNRTFSKAILLHVVPVVQVFNEAVPSWAPAGTDCSAIQFTCEAPLEPSPYSKTQTVNALLFTDSTQIAAPFPRARVEPSVAWLTEMKTLISCPTVKSSSKETFLQANRLIVVVTLNLPALKLSPVVQTRTNY